MEAREKQKQKEKKKSRFTQLSLGIWSIFLAWSMQDSANSPWKINFNLVCILTNGSQDKDYQSFAKAASIQGKKD